MTQSSVLTSAAGGALLLAAVAASLAGCTTAEQYSIRADQVVEGILEEPASNKLRPEPVAYPTLDDSQSIVLDETLDEATPEPELRVLTLEDALAISIQTGRDYIDQKESLFLTILGLSGTRHAYTPQLTALLGYTFTDGSNVDLSQGGTASASLTQILPWGADLSVSASTGYSELDYDGSYDSGASIALSQPLLRGAGRKVSHEPLIQAERNLIYALRSFERFRESYAIDVASQYYALVQQKQALENQRGSLKGLEFSRRQAEAKYSLGEVREVEVLRARRSELSAQNDLLEQEENLDLATDRFRVFLGLTDDVDIDVVTIAPEFVPVHYDVKSAIGVALKNRLDHLTEQDQIEDSERNLDLVRDNLRASLSLDVGYNQGGDPGSSFFDQTLDDEGWNAGLTLDVPVDRVSERNAYRAAQIGHARTLRAFDKFQDDLVVGVRNRFRRLRRIELSLAIQRETIGDEERNLMQAQFLFDRGEAGNRDVVEAQEALVSAQNDLISEQVNYEIERLQLLRDLGILFIDETGMWN